MFHEAMSIQIQEGLSDMEKHNLAKVEAAKFEISEAMVAATANAITRLVGDEIQRSVLPVEELAAEFLEAARLAYDLPDQIVP